MNLIEYINRNRTDLSGIPVSRGVVLERFRRRDNVGDYIAEVIFDWMLKRKGLDAASGKNAHLFTVGSILGFSAANGVVWGSGVLEAWKASQITMHRGFVRYDIRAVRGPITRDILTAAGYKCWYVPFGDPGILMPLIVQKPKQEKKYKYCVVNHFVNENSHQDEGEDTLTVSAGTNDYEGFIRSICSAEKVISSSLHGIILAEAYHIPVIWLMEKTEISAMKFYDYYFSTGRYNIPVATSVEEAKKMEAAPLPDLIVMQQALIRAFPYDLWS